MVLECLYSTQVISINRLNSNYLTYQYNCLILTFNKIRIHFLVLTKNYMNLFILPNNYFILLINFLILIVVNFIMNSTIRNIISFINIEYYSMIQCF